jgi:hypothetical protein
MIVASASVGQYLVTFVLVSPGHDRKLPALIAFNRAYFLGAPAVVCRYSISAAVFGGSYVSRWYSVVYASDVGILGSSTSPGASVAGQVGPSTFIGTIAHVGAQGT